MASETRESKNRRLLTQFEDAAVAYTLLAQLERDTPAARSALKAPTERALVEYGALKDEVLRLMNREGKRDGE